MERIEPTIAREPKAPRRATSGETMRRERGFQKVTPVGSTEVMRHNRPTRRLVRAIGAFVLFVALAVGIFLGAEPAMKMLERPLSSVAVEGEFKYISRERAMELINAELDDDFLKLDLMRLKRSLENDPWVEYAALGRRWPDTLLVRVVEQKPIAKFGEGAFLNQRGEIVHVPSNETLEGLPGLYGDELVARQIMQQYQDLSQLLRSRGLEIIELRLDEKNAWRMTLKGDIEIVVGRDQVIEKIQRLLVVYDHHLQALWHEIKAVDVRYTNGIAVQWLEESDAGKQFLKTI